MTESSAAERQLRQALYRFDCPSPHMLGEYQLDLLDPEARTRVAAHVLECAHCAGELSTLRRFLRPEPRPAPEAAPNSLGERVRQVVATLLTARGAPALGGLRGTADAPSETYQAGGLLITVGPGPDAGRGRGSLLGLVVPETADGSGLPGSEVRLVTAGGEQRRTRLEAIGDFAFDDLPPGQYRLELHLPYQVVIVEDLTVRLP